MPPQPGETTLLTIFADVHYFFAPETQKPIHHRFEKGSYVYIHQNNADGRGRIEVANNAGTPSQDAFAGALELAHITFTYKKPTFFSIALPPAPQIQQKPWQIPAYDLRHERKYMYPIHAIDLYLWGPDDAVDLVEALSAIAPIGALNVEAPPPDDDQQHADPHDTLNAVVQQLEQAAIGPPYKRASTSTTQSSSHGPSAAGTDPPTGAEQTQGSADASAAFAPAPLAYNPAAPPAPEARVHREKTPPPPEGNMPVGASSISQPGAYPFAQQAQGPQAALYAGGSPPLPPPPPQQHASSPPQHASSPPAAQSFPPPPASSPPSGAAATQQGYTAQPLASPGFPPQQQQQQQQQGYQQQYQPQYQPQLQSQQQQQQQQYQPQQPQQQTYSTYSYSTTNAAPPPAHAIHQQFYRPTEAEAGRVHAGALGPSALTPQQMQLPPGQQQPAKTGRVSRVEKGVNRVFARLDKKF